MIHNPHAHAADANPTPVVSLDAVSKIYDMGTVQVHALRTVNLSVASGEFVAIIGPSGSGKSTLMHILGCLDTPTKGVIRLEGHDISTFSKNKRARIRNTRIGFVFQAFNLLPRFTVRQNVEMPMIYSNLSRRERRNRATDLINRVGLADRAHHYPRQLSGGQRQRAAIARALVMDPAIIFADEPTGNLDSRTGEQILALFDKLNKQGSTIILVTHDQYIADRASRQIAIHDGKIVKDSNAAQYLSTATRQEYP